MGIQTHALYSHAHMIQWSAVEPENFIFGEAIMQEIIFWKGQMKESLKLPPTLMGILKILGGP